MTATPVFKAAWPYQQDLLALPVTDVDAAAAWYSQAFGMREVERREQPHPGVVLERDGVQLGFAVTGGDPSQDGAALEVTHIAALRDELEAKGIQTGNWRIDERDGQRLQVFFVVAPDGLCFYVFEPLGSTSDADSHS